MLTSYEGLILNGLSGSLFCRAVTSTVYDEMVAREQPSNSNAERILLLFYDPVASTLKQRSEEGFSVCAFSFRKMCENNTNNSNDLWFEVSSPLVGGGK